MHKIKIFLKSELFKELVRFVIVGGLATVADFLTMSFVLYLMQPAIYPDFLSIFLGGTQDPKTLATVVGTGSGFLIGLAVNYILSVFFVYKEKGNSKTLQGFLLFAVLSFGGFLIHVLGMYLGYDLLHINEWLIKIFLTAVVLVYNYLTRKFFIFKKSSAEKSAVKTNSAEVQDADLQTKTAPQQSTQEFFAKQEPISDSLLKKTAPADTNDRRAG